MAKSRNVDMSAKVDEIKIVAAPEDSAETQPTAEAEVAEGSKVNKKAKQGRSARYQAVRAQVDRTRKYDLATAVEMVKKLSYSKFKGSVEAALVVKEVGFSTSVSFPHSTGKSIKVAIVDDQILQDIEDGKIDFDVLVSKPEYMPKLAKFAKVLGPKGLMPNPKNGTLTTNPELKAKELQSGKMTIKTEKKAPLINLSVGKISMDDKELIENLEALLKAVKGKLVRLSISATMGPGIKVAFEQ
ncbi:MAG: hypothetical protein ACOZAN_02905 [Patescibacteria group bacterium]